MLRFNCKYKHLEGLMPEVIKRYKSGESIFTLSKEYGMSHQTLSRYLKKFGVIITKRRYPSHLKGKHHTQQARYKLRLSRLGKRATKETREKLSRATSGSNNPNWRGGLWLGPNGYKILKKDRDGVLDRDGHHCVLCQQSVKLNVHHVDYDRVNGSSDNLITLCKRCHGITNGHRDYWTQFFWRIIL